MAAVGLQRRDCHGGPTTQPLLPLGIWKILRNCGHKRSGRILDGQKMESLKCRKESGLAARYDEQVTTNKLNN